MENNNIENAYICITKDEYDKLLEAYFTLKVIRKVHEAKGRSYLTGDVLNVVFGTEEMEGDA